MGLITVKNYPPSGWSKSNSDQQEARNWCENLEKGNIVYFQKSPIRVSEEDQKFLLAAEQTGTRLHKNIAYRPAQDRITGLSKDTTGRDVEQLREIMRRFSNSVVEFASDFLAPYERRWKLDYASYRPIEEEGRNLSTRARNDLVHVDNFPTRPTNGDLILRIFTNINPRQDRVWVTGPPFHTLVQEHAPRAGLDKVVNRVNSPTAGLRRAVLQAGHAIGLPVVSRPPYDEFMLGFHHYMKESQQFQNTIEKERHVFPPGSGWMVFTDKVPHAVLSGRCALEQTFLVSKDALVLRDLAPVSVLEKMTNVVMTY